MLKKWKWHWISMALAVGGILLLAMPGFSAGFQKAGEHVQTVFTAASAQPKVMTAKPQQSFMLISNRDGGAEKTTEKDGTEKTNLEETNIETIETASAEKTNTEKTTVIPEVPCTAKDYQVLLNIVQAEAGGCDAIGKILVTNVILNRVKSEMFPDTITDVVYEKSQFSPVRNGTINQVEVSDSTEKSVIRALLGEDYSQGALYFMNRRSSSSGGASWFDRKLTYLFQYETHEFFK